MGELETAFRDSIDDYLKFCVQRCEKPDKPFSGRLPRSPAAELGKVLAVHDVTTRCDDCDCHRSTKKGKADLNLLVEG